MGRVVSSLIFATLFGCSSEPTGSLDIVLGEETDALTRAPSPTRLAVDAIALDGTVSSLATVRLPAASIDLGKLSASRIASVRVAAVDDAGNELLRGRSLPIELGALSGTSFPIFLQRTSEFARMPEPLADGREDPVAVSIASRYVAVAGGAADVAKRGTLYDLAFLQSYTFPGDLPRAPASIAAAGTQILVIDAAGASWVDLATFSVADALTPQGGAFADIAGGATVPAENGVSYVVGATRIAGEPSSRVLRIDADGTLTFVTLTTPRRGAAAAWASGRGLVVAGGSATAPGVELVGSGATVSVPLPFPPRDVAGAAAVAQDDGQLVLLGGTTGTGEAAPSEALSLACVSACAPRPWSTALPAHITRAQAFAVSATRVLVIGHGDDGSTLAFHADETASTSVPLRIPRKRAQALRLYNGSVAVVGGAAAVESYAP